MNFDINILRIFEDYVQELLQKNKLPEVADGISAFKKKFADIRNEIDELRHEMHLHKMKLAAISREGIQPEDQTYLADAHDAIQIQFLDFRKKIEMLKTEFTDFENKWLN
jgi:uncharacterized coiled-coil DUF342 family protein